MSDPATDIQKQNEVLNNDIRQDKNRYYDFHAYPENYGLEKKQGFKIYGDHQDFVPELAKLEALFSKQGRVIKIAGQVVDVVREKSVINKNGKATEVPIEVAVHAPQGYDTKRLTLTFAKTKKWGNIKL